MTAGFGVTVLFNPLCSFFLHILTTESCVLRVHKAEADLHPLAD